MNVSDLLVASQKYHNKQTTLEPLVLHVTSRAEKTQKSQLAFILKYATQAPSSEITAILSGFLSICELQLAYSAIPHVMSSQPMQIAVTRSIEAQMRPIISPIVQTLTDEPKITDQLIQDILHLETKIALEKDVLPPYALAQEVANATLLLLQQNQRLLNASYFFIALTLQTSTLAGANLFKQICISHQYSDQSKLLSYLIDQSVIFDYSLAFDTIKQSFRNPILLAKLGVLTEKTDETAMILIHKLQENPNTPIQQFVFAFKILVKFDFHSNEKLIQSLCHLSKLITIFSHFHTLILDMGTCVKKHKNGYHFLQIFINLVIQQQQNVGKSTQILCKLAENFDLYENLQIFGVGIENIQFVAFSSSCRFEEFTTAFLNWSEESKKYEKQQKNIVISLQNLISILKNIELDDFIEENYMLFIENSREILELLAANSKLKFLTLINQNDDQTNAVFSKFALALTQTNLQEILVGTSQPTIENTCKFIATLPANTEIKTSVSFLVQKVAILPQLAPEAQQIVVSLLACFIERFGDCLGAQTGQIMSVLIAQMLKNNYDQNCCFKVLNGFAKVNLEGAVALFDECKLDMKYRVRFVAENLTARVESYKNEVLQGLCIENSKGRNAAVDVVFKLAENGTDISKFVTQEATIQNVKFMTYYGFRIGEIMKLQLDEYVKMGQLPVFPVEFVQFAQFLFTQNYSQKQPILNYIEMLFCNLDSMQLQQFLDQYSFNIYEMILVPKFRSQIKRIFIAAGLCVGRDFVNEILTSNLAVLSQQLGNFEATRTARTVQTKIMHVLKKVSPQSYPGRYEANTYIQLNITLPSHLRSQLSNKNYNDDEIIKIGNSNQDEIDELLFQKVDELDQHENYDEFIDQVSHKNNQDRILENVKDELKMIEARRMQQHLSNINTGIQFKAKGAGGDITRNGKRPSATIPLHGKLSKHQQRGVQQVISGVFKRDKVGQTKLARAVQERISKGSKANSIKAGKVQGGRQKIKAAMKHAKK
ncbi:hypothetical protein SS50377_23696 [Spironucleus salmonicida]|uniref:Uncharacterized protein n=1 Tax=Spironucleus salmonicida TaxID=348837 RepID=V6LWS8_9EUKA|nr:hypothetical protein SS50377_23696 [Spironucleus salmonicida]|eukprot:EST48678.1 Hypothetical protein SS50377_11291 [Spironucleus salmonicida]